jgi:hypothetical protein
MIHFVPTAISHRLPLLRAAILIDRYTQSPLAIAPPFRTLHQRYPFGSLEEALGEGLVTGHPSMPEFRLDLGQVGDFISVLKSLEQWSLSGSDGIRPEALFFLRHLPLTVEAQNQRWAR